MSSWLWTPASGMSQIAFSGHREFRDTRQPVADKDEWGVDVLERTMRGPGSDFAAEEAKLKQGMVYASHFYLQTWRPIDHAIFPGFQLLYKGFRNGVIPEALPTTTFSELVSSVDAEDLHVSYNDRVIISASKEVKYVAPTTTYRYISRGRPEGPRYSTVDTNQTIQNLDSRTVVTLLNEADNTTTTQTLTGSAPAAVATALAGVPTIFVVGPSFEPILGTPYYECMEVVQLKYPG